ncbi:maestro heat-like repeat family member 5 isoform X3 [Hemicordylus capensis]|uniref:maestro heat-like repeat family member 5 isoform X3 n=1 Tax=Hemicordylus capensis TaxID=884348 RepID=UPI00230220F0|nr:maestro heat-like repeat family member 5 isoform X3 [Hemicordylus capensis]
MTLCGRICSVFKGASHRKNRICAHPLAEEEPSADRDCPLQKDKEEIQKEELDENESQVCFCNLRNLREGNGPSLVQTSMDNLSALAEIKLAGVLRAICKYRQSIHKISPRHRLRINEILQAIICSARSVDYRLAHVIIKLAAEDMLRTTDLQDLYQDAAGDILVALWDHFPAEVLARLLEGFQGRLLPYRSILCVLGKLANKAFTESDSVKIDVWERKLVEFVERLLIDVTDKACCEELSQELMKAAQTGKNHCPEKVFLYQYYGAILRTSDDTQLVQEQLCKILALSHRGPSEAKGIASAVGLAASRHLDEAFKALEDFSKNDSIREASGTKTSQGCKWTTLLLCYGRVALGIKEEVLPRVEFILSKMIEYFTISPVDMNLKKSFLIAVLMFLEAISATGKAQGLRLRMKMPLVDCLIVLIEREPAHILANTVRQDAMYIVKELSKLKPLLEAPQKSSLLFTAFKSTFCLAPLESLGGSPCNLEEQAADVPGLYQQTMHSLGEMLQGLLLENLRPSELQTMLELMEPWMASRLDHERERAVETAMKLLKFVAIYLHLELSQEFSKLAHLTAVLIALCNDPVARISSLAVQGVSCLYELLLHRKALRRSKQKRRKWSLRRSCRLQEAESLALVMLGGAWRMAMHSEDQLFRAQLTNLLLLVLDSLRGSNPELLTAAEEVKDIVRAIYTCLQLRQSSYWTRKVVLRALGFIIPHHMEEVTRSCLAFSIPVDRQASELWTAMASGPQVALQVLQLLLKNLQLKGTLEADEDSIGLSLAAMNVIYETFHIPGYRTALAEMHLQLFIPLLKQVLYVMHLEVPEPLRARQECLLRGNPEARSFQSTSVEIMKSLFSVAGDWEVYACIEFRQGWRVLSTPQQFLQGTRLLARAMTECDSPQIPGIFGEAALILDSEEDELKKMTALALVIEFLKSPSAVKMMNRFSLKDHLEEGVAASNLVIKELCLKGLNSFVFQQGKVKLLRDQLPALIDSVFSGHEGSILEGLRDIMTAVYEMDGQGIGPLCVDLALNVRSFFEDERASVRTTAIALFGQLVTRVKKVDKALLKKEVVYSLLPLLLHLRDRDPGVAMSCKLAFLHCAVFLGWAHLKLMFRSMAWEDTRSCLVTVWKYLMRNNHDNIHVFISQALGYLHHPQIEIRHAAARFTGHSLNYYSSELSKNLEQEDIIYLNKVFQEIESSPDPIMAHFAKTYRVVLQKLCVKRRLAGAGEKEAQVTDNSLGGKHLSSDYDVRVASPRLLLPPPDSPLPEGPAVLLGSDFLTVQTPKRARRPLALRGRAPSAEARERDRQHWAEAPAGNLAPRGALGDGSKQSPPQADAPLSQAGIQPEQVPPSESPFPRQPPPQAFPRLQGSGQPRREGKGRRVP